MSDTLFWIWVLIACWIGFWIGVLFTGLLLRKRGR